jgi:hypothetical protein
VEGEFFDEATRPSLLYHYITNRKWTIARVAIGRSGREQLDQRSMLGRYVDDSMNSDVLDAVAVGPDDNTQRLETT